MPQGWTPVEEQSGWTPVAEASPATLSVPRDARGMPRVSSNLSDSEQPSRLLEMLGPLAHPETLTDFARLLTLPVDSVRRALAGTLLAAQARPAATATVQAVKNAPAAAGRAVVNTAAAAGDVVDPSVIGMASPRVGKAVEFAQRIRDARAAAAAAAPTTGVAPTVAEAAPVASRAATALPNQKLLNELAIAARRAKVVLTPETEQAAIQAVTKGATPAEAVASVRPAVAPPVAAPVAPASPAVPSAAGSASLPPGTAGLKLSLTAPEMKEFLRVVQSGKSETAALGHVMRARELAKRLGGATGEQVRQAVQHRNEMGRWD